MPINKYLISKEKAFTTQLVRAFRGLEKDIKRLLIKQDTQKDFQIDIRGLLDKFNLALAVIISGRSKTTIKKASDVQANLFKSNFVLNWNLPNEPAQKYLDDIVKLHSSNIRMGSIGHTTYTRTMKLIANGLKERLTYTEIAEQITELDPLVFSKGRAENIAVTELGNAYEYGKYRTMQDIGEKGEIVLKKWSTVQDERVRPTHLQNESDGYIGFDEIFSGTGSLIAPAGNYCRCSIIYSLI